MFQASEPSTRMKSVGESLAPWLYNDRTQVAAMLGFWQPMNIWLKLRRSQSKLLLLIPGYHMIIYPCTTRLLSFDWVLTSYPIKVMPTELMIWAGRAPPSAVRGALGAVWPVLGCRLVKPQFIISRISPIIMVIQLMQNGWSMIIEDNLKSYECEHDPLFLAQIFTKKNSQCINVTNNPYQSWTSWWL